MKKSKKKLYPTEVKLPELIDRVNEQSLRVIYLVEKDFEVVREINLQKQSNIINWHIEVSNISNEYEVVEVRKN